MKKYESTFIVKSDKEDKIDDIVDEVVNLIEQMNGEIEKVDRWGLKKLAYEIKGNRDGFYNVIDFTLEEGNIEKLKEHFQKNNDILRYIVIKLEE